MSREIVLIYARAENGTIGRDGGLPWHLPADLKRFKRLTMGSPMIMGRKTFESFPAPLPGRKHIVLSRDRRLRLDGAELATDVDQALDRAAEHTVWVIGGAQVFELFANRADRIEATEIHAEIAGDTFMPAPGPEWREIAREDFPAEDGRPAYSFVTYRRAG